MYHRCLVLVGLVVSFVTACSNTTPSDSSAMTETAETLVHTSSLTETVTNDATPTAPIADVTVINGGNLRTAPQVTPDTIIGQVCPGDQMVRLETQDEWMRVRLVVPAADCVAERVAVETEGWLSTTLIVPQQPLSPGQPQMPAGLTPAIVRTVVDGDTLEVLQGGAAQRIRLIGIDTPETSHPTKPVECFGHAATAHATELLSEQVVLLEADPTQGDADQYDRLLRFVWLLDGRLVNYALLVEGYAFEYTFNLPYTYQEAFRTAEETARTKQRGLWAPTACNGERSPVEQDAPVPTTPAAPAPAAQPRGNCDPSYPDVCIPPPPPDLDCEDVAPECRFRVLAPDPHQFDGDGDGLGCERCP